MKKHEMKIYINGQSIKLAENSSTLAEALTLFLAPHQQHQSFAVALNSEFVGRTCYQQTLLQEGDSVDVLFPIQGG